MEKQKLMDNLAHKVREIDQLKVQLEEQVQMRAQAEEQKSIKDRELEVLLEKERMQTHKNKIDAIAIEKEKQLKGGK